MKGTKLISLNLFFACFLFTGIIYAQEKNVTGKVTDGSGMELPGVNVIIKGTTTGTTTDFNGQYTIEVPGNEAILVFSYYGLTTVEKLVGTNSQLDVTMTDDVSQLDEVVVLGYGASKKSDVTGSVSSVKSEELNAFPVLNAQQALQGRAAGVAVQTNNGGEPGSPISVKIRGNTSIGASSAALIVVDGFVGAEMPQASDIQSIEVLKDASATAIYGSRGANGVIMVTTKKGRNEKTKVEINSSYATQNVSNTLDLLNASQFAAYQSAIIPSYSQGPADTDWQDMIYRTGETQNHQLSFSGGTDDVKYYASGTYFDQKGVVVNSKYKLYSFLTNVESKVNNWLKLGVNGFGSRSSKDGISTQASTGGAGSGDVISIMYKFAPDLGVFDENGDYTFNSVGDEVDNPYAIATQTIDETVVDKYRVNFFADFQITEELMFKSTFGFSSHNSTRGTFKPSTLIISAGSQGGIAEVANQRRTKVLSENYLTYTKAFKKSNLTALLGYSFQSNKTEVNTAGAQGFITDNVSYRNLGQGAVPLTPGSSLSETEIVSQFGRINYVYDDKYLFTFTGRRDGSSNFAKNEKYAFFPSGALGWNISNEDFLSDSNTVSNLKLRLSYGATGSQSISPYQSLALYRDIYAVVGDKTVNAVVPYQLSNPDLKWETSYQSNIGVDLGLLDNRISLAFDYYNIDTKDLILGDTSAPEYVGFLNLTALKNVGEINNRGMEFTISSRNIDHDKFSWVMDINWSRNRNEVVKLVNEDDIFLDSAPGHFLQDETHILREGEAVGVFYGYEYRGVNQGGTLPDGTAGFNNVAGEELFSDLNGDGMITSADRKIIGDPNQDWTWGFDNTFRYKNFDLGVFFQGAVGGDIFSYTLLELASGGSNATTDALRAWTPSNTNTNVPSAAVREKRITSRFVYDGTYARLKNLAIGYNFSQEVLERIGMDKLRLSISAQNLWTITDYPGLDPEVSYLSSGNMNSNVNQGFEYGNYPNIKSVTLGLNLRF